MPWLPVDEIRKVEPRWPVNKYGIQAPDDICGDYQCVCADKARAILTDAEYQLAFGLPKDYGREDGDDGPGFTIRSYYG